MRERMLELRNSNDRNLRESCPNSSGEFLLEAGAFAGALPQEVQLRPADMGAAVHDDLFDPGRAHQEGALDADAVAGDAPHGEISIVAAAPHAQHCTPKFLGALGIAFLDAQEHADRVARLEAGDVGVIGGLDGLEEFAHRSQPALSYNDCTQL